MSFDRNPVHLAGGGLAALGILAAFILATAGAAQAEVSGGAVTGGQAQANGGVFQVLTDPIGVIGNNQFNDYDVRAWDELQDVILTGPLILDAPAPGITSNVIGAGSTISSHYVLYDPPLLRDAIGSVTFDEPVIGIIRTNVRFNETDALLGNPTASYDIGDQGLELSDVITISGNTINFDLTTSSPGDAIRVLTGIAPISGINVCAPGATTLSGLITGGNVQPLGGEFKQICDPIGDVGDDNFDSYDLFAFEEQQAVELDADLFLDDVNFIASGETVSSFYVVFDPNLVQGVEATITFPDAIIGVITDEPELLASDFMGNASANYLNPGLRGLESGDSVSFVGAELILDFSASTPGDSIRVILGSASPSLTYDVCDPGAETLAGALTGGSAFSAGGVFSELCEPIGPVGNDNFQSNDLFAFEEAQAVQLTAALDVDLPVVSTVASGTWVSSYYVAFDPGSSKDAIGTITFPGDILGVMTSVDTLTDSDFLGNPTGVYLNPGLRGLEGGVDSVSFVGNTLSVDLSANTPGDYVRVLVASAPPAVPALGPAALTSVCAALLGFGTFSAGRGRGGRGGR